MELKLKKVNAQRIRVNIAFLILQTLLTIGMFLATISVSIGGISAKSIVFFWLFSLYFLYGSIWLGLILAFDLKGKINNTNDIKLLFSGIGSIICLFTLIVWIFFVREIYFDRKYSIDFLETTDEVSSSKGE
ncbi:hypothetical protein [Spiroplasma culicicola]|uniref:Transmembrane protein n=1 Tax=Spiroplasma culicicola AES-1 TaxID=1276246 RepID=W6A7D2_9MOLU|nr:hypothetical protein [Spiroplasma culicicola]AHI52745.1 hypothetical protein SCULI_v1c04040 [Spiroplasma culicicola AES-1]